VEVHSESGAGLVRRGLGGQRGAAVIARRHGTGPFTPAMRTSLPSLPRFLSKPVLAFALLAGCQSAPTTTGSATGAAPSPPLMPHPITAEAVPPLAVTPPVRINCGASRKLTDSEGHVWFADQGYSDGNAYEVDDAPVTGTMDPDLFRTERYSVGAYRFGVPNGRYTVRLLFAEVYTGITGPGGRVFSFDVQGHEFKDFDIWVKAGGPDKAYVQSVDVEVTNGILNISFTPGVENPKIDGIEILPRP